MDFNVGDTVIHWNYGVGEIVQIDQKQLTGRPSAYYVVKIRDMTVWVPTDSPDPSSLRPPTPPADFAELFAILRSPGEPLPEDRVERKQHLQGKFKDGRLASICQVVRDLSHYRVIKKINDNDKTILEHARQLLVSEWGLSLAIPPAQVERELTTLLEA